MYARIFFIFIAVAGFCESTEAVDLQIEVDVRKPVVTDGFPTSIR